MSREDRIGVLFVCLGNICRSPMAEGVFRHLVEGEGLAGSFRIDSAGTGAWHEGEAPDQRAAEAALRQGVTLTGKARQVRPLDLKEFDFILAMDAENLRTLERLKRLVAPEAEVALLRSFDAGSGDDLDVPDPYYDGPRGFDSVYELIERACRGLLSHIREERGI